MHLLGCLLGLFLGILLLVLNVGLRLWWNIRNILKGGTGSTQRPNPFGQTGNGQGTQGNSSNSRQTSQSNQSSQPSHSKVFADNEGEYVDFEEIK